MKFTDRIIAKLPPPPPGRKDYLLFDDKTQGLAVRVGIGSKRFIFQVRPEGGAQYRQTLGKFPALNVDEARKAVKVLAGRVAKGDDLRAEKTARKVKRGQARADTGYSFGDLILDWEEAPTASKRRPRRPSYIKGTADGLRRAYEHLLDKPAASITSEQLEEVWKSLADADLPAAANAAAERVRTVFSWGVKTKKLSVDPTQGVDLPEKPEKRTHAPTGAEARNIWAASSTMSARDRAAISLLQVSLLRRTEAFGALWSEFSDNYSKFSPSPQRMKMGKPFVVWLPPVMQKMLAELPKFEGSDLLFSRDGRKPLTGYTALKERLDKALKGSGVRPFRLHDLRRSGVTWLAEAGVSSIVADRLLGHASLKSISPTADIYNVYEFATERQAALRLWADFLMGEEEAKALPSFPLMLPAPEPEAAAVPPSAAPPFATAADYAHARVQDMEHKSEVAARFVAKSTRILTNPGVMRANEQIRKSKQFASAFQEKHRGDPHAAAFLTLTYRAAELAINGETVLKSSEIEAQRTRWRENADKLRTDAKRARAEAKEARELGREEFACEADARAQEFDRKADIWEQMLLGFITTDDPRCVKYRAAEETHASSRALGVLQALRLLNVEIFGNEHGTWAAAYAEAAVGWKVSRDQGRRRLKVWTIPLKSAAR